MKRLDYSTCKPLYDILGLQFEERWDSELNQIIGNNAQYEVIIGNERFPLIIGGERGGKSWATAAIMLPHIVLLPEIRKDRFYKDGVLKYDPNEKKSLVPDFVLFGPSYAEPRIEFQYIVNWLMDLDELSYLSNPREGPWTLITKSGVVVTTWSTNDPASIRAIDLEGAAACECGNMEEDAIMRIQGRISTKRGFCIYSGTMESAKRWYIRLALEGERQNRYLVKTYSIPSWSNRFAYPDGRYDEEIKRLEAIYPDDIFQMRVAAKPVPPRDRVIREINETEIKKVKLPRSPDGRLDCEIEICVDPGYLPSAYAVLWCAHWKTGDGEFFYFFDELYKQQIQNEDVIQWVKKHKFYKYLKTDGLTIDVSAKRHADGNEPAIEKYKKLTKLTNPYTHYWHEKALIDRIRTTAKAGNIAIHPNCVGLIAELGLGEEIFPDMHPWKFPTSKGDNAIINEKPIDRWNHSCKAMGYLLLRHLKLVEKMGERPKPMNRIRDRFPGGIKRNSIFNSRRVS